MAPKTLGKFHSPSNFSASFFHSVGADGILGYLGAKRVHKASQTCFLIFFTVARPNRKLKLGDCWLLPVAKYLRSTANHSAGIIGSFVTELFLRPYSNGLKRWSHWLTWMLQDIFLMPLTLDTLHHRNNNLNLKCTSCCIVPRLPVLGQRLQSKTV